MKTEIIKTFPCIPPELFARGRFEFRPGASAVIIYGLPFADYLKIRAHSSGALKTVALQSPKHKHLFDPTIEKPAWTFGSGTHCSVLEPSHFTERFAKWDVFNCESGKLRPRRKDSDYYKDWCAEHEGQKCLTPDEYDLALAMHSIVHGHPRVLGEGLLSGGAAEVTLVWEWRPGTFVKVRCDYLNQGGAADLKTTRVKMIIGGEGLLLNESAVRGYHVQVSLYDDAVAAAIPDWSNPFNLIFVEKSEPHCVAVLELDEAWLTHGRELYESAIETTIKCRETGIWPGPFDAEIINGHEPIWAQSDKLKADYSGVA